MQHRWQIVAEQDGSFTWRKFTTFGNIVDQLVSSQRFPTIEKAIEDARNYGLNLKDPKSLVQYVRDTTASGGHVPA